MKQSLYACFTLWCTLMTGCSNDEVVESVQEEVRVIGSLDDDARTTYQEGTYNGSPVLRVMWDEGDAIGLYGMKNYPYQSNLKYTTSQNGGVGSFKAVSTPLSNTNDSVYAYYPYSEYSDPAWAGQLVRMPDTYEQTYQPDKGVNFYYAKGLVQDNKLSLKFKSFFTTIRIAIPKAWASDNEWGLRVSTSNSSNDAYCSVTHTESYSTNFNFKTEGLNGYAKQGRLTYKMPKKSEFTTDSIVCHIAMLPQEYGTTVSIGSLVGSSLTPLISKEVPAEGFKAGYVYSFNWDSYQYESTDFSADGEVFPINQASQGNGINLVFVGEGFVDKDMNAGGKYEQRMKDAVDQLFSIEPYQSFRNRFNVYGVKAVSKHGHFLPGAEHVFEEEKNLVDSNRKRVADKKAFDYAEKVREWAEGNNMGWNVNQERHMVAVIYNTTGSVSRSYAQSYSGDGSFVAYVMDAAGEVLIHEVGGHGVAHLADEYVEFDIAMPTTPDDYTQNGKAWLDWGATKDWGWYANVDYHTGSQNKWYHMELDSRYADEVGLFEGAYTFKWGVYRPTDDSMMNHNILWFNAPSREAIYKAIMTMSEGDTWVYDFEDFAFYDAMNRSSSISNLRSRAVSEDERKAWRIRHRGPEYNEGTWRDVVNSIPSVPFR